MKYKLVSVCLTDENNNYFMPAIVLEEYNEKLLLAIFKEYCFNEYNVYVLRKSMHPQLSISLEFNGNIFLTDKTKVRESFFKIKLTESDMKMFIKTLGLLDMSRMTIEEFQAFTAFISKYNEILVKEGSVIPVIKDLSGKLHTYYVEEKTDQGLICIPLSYEPNTGLKIKSFEREFISYEVYVTGVYYTSLQEQRIKEMLESNSLKLKWVTFICNKSTIVVK